MIEWYGQAPLAPSIIVPGKLARSNTAFTKPMLRSPSGSHNSRPFTIGMLTARLNGPTELNLWHGVAERAAQRNVNLICFSGGIPGAQQQFEAQKNVLYNIAGSLNVDGLLIWANILSHTLDVPGLEAFCQHYAPLPIISMGMVLPGFPSIRIDMREGEHKLLSHLIEQHGRRKIAFIRGLEVSQDAEERYQAYLETLRQYGLSLDPDLIVSGDFRRFSGTAAVRQLIESGHTSFDALVSANDNMAIGAMQALQAHGMRVPDDVIVAGFDDIEETRAIAPSLTTVRAPLHLLGSKSLDLVLSKLENEELPDQILLETEIIRRQSCGCQQIVTGVRREAALGLQPPGRAGMMAIRSGLPSDRSSQPVEDLNGMLSSLPPLRGLGAHWSEHLLECFLNEARSKNDASSEFIQLLVEALAQNPSGTEILEWLDVLNALGMQLASLFEREDEIDTAHCLLENGYKVVAEMAHRRQLNQRLEAVEQTNRLNRIVQTLSTTHDIDTLMKLLALELPGLGIESCFLSLYDEKGDPPAWSRLILAFLGTQRLPLAKGGIRFPTRQLLPEGMFPADRRIAFDVEALTFQDEQIGYVLFEIGPRDGDIYTTLRGHLSSALKSAELVEIALEAEAKAIKGDQLKTHLLANVSHELRTPLNIIMGLSQTALATPNPYGIDLPAQLGKDIGYIYASGEHLIRLINDLLDTSRAEIGELDLCYEPVSPRGLIKEVFEAFNATSTSSHKDVNLLLDIPERLPVLNADPLRLRQIIMNLLSNAYKFTRQGQILLGADVQLPHLHVWVSDTGSGISPDLQERIFEPFVKAEAPGRRHDGIGLGLSITRRLVALHGGTITLDSLPGHGSTFHVYLPLPGLDNASAKEVDAQGAEPALLWLSSKKEPAPAIMDISRRNGIAVHWLGNTDDLDRLLAERKPVGLAWDLENARPGDWSIVQKLRSHSQYCQLPLLIIHENITDKLSAGSRLTNVLLKPSGKQMLQHILNLLPQALQRGEIWVIDDDPMALRYYQEMIGSFLSEFLVRPIKGGRQALNLLQEATPDLVLLDLIMPDVDGFQVLEHLRNNVKTAQIPVVIITGKILTYEDVKRLDVPRVILQTKGVLSDLESVAEIQRVLTPNSALPQATATLVKQASAYIQQNYTRTFSLEELSETVGVSKSYLSRIFKMGTGISPWDYLNRFRVQKAKELLLLSDESITAIAADVGYEDVGYFGRVFREIAGCTPRAFRQQGQDSNPV
jgi:signal transduction histidine kinase/DNA-binding LacI/PurR family transcriptional regulator/AraC-like DNA-binding protein